MNVFDYRSELSKFKYSREKEIEADIMAYRFMEFSGMDPKEYINALCKLVGFSNDRNDPDYNKKGMNFYIVTMMRTRSLHIPHWLIGAACWNI